MKERLDVLLVKRNLVGSREKAKAVIMSGNVFVDGQREDKAGTTFSDEVQIEDQRTYTSICQQRRIKAGKSACQF